MGVATACNLLVVSKGCKGAVLQSQAFVQIAIYIRGTDLRKMIAFTTWLSKYGSLVRVLLVEGERLNASVSEPAAHMLVQSLRLASAAGMRLGIKAFQTNFMFSSAVMASLPQCSLTCLVFRALTQYHAVAGSITNPLSTLTNLQEIRLCGGMFSTSENTVFPDGCLDGLRPLTQLTLLCLEAASVQTWPPVRCLPPSIQQLKVISAGACLLDISNLTSLRKLDVNAYGGLAEGSTFPLTVPLLLLNSTPLPASTQLSSLFRGVQQIISRSNVAPADSFASLGQLPALQKVKWVYINCLSASAAGARAWGQVPQLLDLSISLPAGSTDECIAMLAGLSAATQLTSLMLDKVPAELPHCCAATSRLSNLKTLEVAGAQVERSDYLHLRQLAQLTYLRLGRSSIDAATAAAVLLKLRKLEVLDLWACPSLSAAVLPVVAEHLQQLQSLSLRWLEEITDGDIGLLVELTQVASLTRLVLSGSGLSRDGLALLRSQVQGRLCIEP